MSFFNSSGRSAYTFTNALVLVLLITLYRFAVLYTSDLNLYADEAYYWGWAQHFEFGYYSKPPMVAWMILVTTSLFGESEVAIKIGSLAFYIVTSMAIYLIGRELFDEKTGFWSMLAFVTLPATSLSTMIISTDAPFLLFWSLSLLMFIKAIRTDRPVFWFFLGFFGGLGLLSKYTMLMFMASALIYLYLSTPYRRHLKNPRLYGAMAVAAIVYLPNLMWNINNHFASFLHTKDNAHLESSLFHIDKMAEFLGSQLAVFGPILFVVLVGLLFRYKRLRDDETFKMLFWFVVPFFTLITTISLLSRAHANWAAPIYIAATLLVVAYLVRTGKMKLLGIAVGINILMGITVYHYYSIANVFGIELTKNTDPQRRVLGWDILGKNVSVIKNDYPEAKFLFDDRKAMASLIYYIHPHPFGALIWNPDKSILNHYELTTDMNREMGSDFIFVTDRKEIESLHPSFETLTPIGTVHIPIHSDYSLDYQVYHLQNFKGYR